MSTIEYRWGGEGGWSSVSNMGDVDVVRRYVAAKYPARVKRGVQLEVRERPRRGGSRPGAGRPVGASAPPTTHIAVRLTDTELAVLGALDPSPSKAIRKLLADIGARPAHLHIVLTAVQRAALNARAAAAGTTVSDYVVSELRLDRLDLD